MSDDEKIAAWIARHGVTRCPPAIVAPSSAVLSAADIAALDRAQQDLEAGWLRKNATSTSSFRIRRRRKAIIGAARSWGRRRTAAC